MLTGELLQRGVRRAESLLLPVLVIEVTNDAQPGAAVDRILALELPGQLDDAIPVRAQPVHHPVELLVDPETGLPTDDRPGVPRG